jgi:hypothetical protein
MCVETLLPPLLRHLVPHPPFAATVAVQSLVQAWLATHSPVTQVSRSIRLLLLLLTVCSLRSAHHDSEEIAAVLSGTAGATWVTEAPYAFCLCAGHHLFCEDVAAAVHQE